MSPSLRQCLFGNVSNFVVRRFRTDRIMPLQHTPGIRIHDENRMVACVEENRVCRLWANAFQLHQLFAQLQGWLGKHRSQRSAIAAIDESYKLFQPFRFLPKIPGRAYEQLEFSKFCCSNLVDTQLTCCAQVRNCSLDVGPRGVLREDRSNNYFERSFRGPPVLRSPAARQLVIDLADDSPRI